MYTIISGCFFELCNIFTMTTENMGADSGGQSGGKKRDRIYQVIIGVLLLAVIIMAWQLMQVSTEVRTVIVEKENITQQLSDELEELMAEHEHIRQAYSEVSGELSERDSMIIEQAKEIERLIASQADYWRVRRKLEYLRNSHKRYVRQIDSLFTVNRELKAENLEIRKQVRETKVEKQIITEEKVHLEDKVNVGSMLKAYNVDVEAIRVGGWLRDTERVTTSPRRLDKIRVCFTISENLLAEPGEKNVYIRIARPDNEVLYHRQEDYFYYNNERLQYSLKLPVNYQNEQQHHCVYWERDEHAKEVMSGTYRVVIFIDDQEVGQGTMVLD